MHEFDDNETLDAAGDEPCVETSGPVEMLQRHRDFRPMVRLQGDRMGAKMPSDRSRAGFGRVGSNRPCQLGSRGKQLVPDDIAGRA